MSKKSSPLPSSDIRPDIFTISFIIRPKERFSAPNKSGTLLLHASRSCKISFYFRACLIATDQIRLAAYDQKIHFTKHKGLLDALEPNEKMKFSQDNLACLNNQISESIYYRCTTTCSFTCKDVNYKAELVIVASILHLEKVFE